MVRSYSICLCSQTTQSAPTRCAWPRRFELTEMLDYDRGPHNADDSLGVAELELDHIIPNKMEYRWLRIKHPEDEGRHPPLGEYL